MAFSVTEGVVHATVHAESDRRCGWKPAHMGGTKSMSKGLARALALLLVLGLVATACSDDKKSNSSGSGGSQSSAEKIDYNGDRPVGRRPVRRGEAAAEDRADDRLRVARALAEGPGDGARGVGEGVQRSAAVPTARASRSHTCDDGANIDQAVACVRTDRRGRRRRDRQRPGHRRPGRGVGGHGASEDPARRVERHARRLGRPERLSDRRVRHRRHVPAAAGAHRRRTSRRSASSASTSPPRRR